MNRKKPLCLKAKSKTRGFTLVELMIAISIVGILSAIAYPKYAVNIRDAKRAEAKGALVSLANAMEQWKIQQTDPNIGYQGAQLGSGGIFPDTVPLSGGTPTYQLSVDVKSATEYQLFAKPVDGDDSELTLDNMGNKTCNSSNAKDTWCVNDTWQ